MISLTLCMIVKNEEAVLERILNPVSEIVDEILIADTGSSDRTKEIAGQYTSQVFDFPWCDDFSAARNFLVEKVRTDYWMWLDADDVMDEKNLEKLKLLKASLDKIRQTASEFIYQIDQKMEVLMADKEQVQESAKAPSPFVQELMDKITEGAKDLGFIPVVPETQEKTANPELKVVVDKALKDLDKKRTLSKVKESVKSKLKSNTEKAEQAPRKSRISKAKEERA